MKTYLKNVTIKRDRRYSRSYGSLETIEFTSAIVDSNWIQLYDNRGIKFTSHQLSGKHFHSYDGDEISEKEFRMMNEELFENWMKERQREEEGMKQAELERYQNWKAKYDYACKILDPMIPRMINDGIELDWTCKGSRSCAYHIRNRYDLNKQNLSIQIIRDWIRDQETINKFK